LVDMVRCEKILEVIQEEELLRNAAAMGQLLIDELSGLAERYPRLVSNVRGRGLLCAFDLPDEPTRSRLRNDLMRHDLLIPFCGPRSLRFRPRLDIRAEDIGKAINTLDARLKAL
jgi:L-lysine 6-transaminase